MQTLERFGPEDRLVGILSGDPGAVDAPVLVLPNAGLVPRAGPFRLHVEIAERLAALGVRTFRFDLPGAGEAPHLAGIDARGATRAALDHLAGRGIGRRFVVGGICSAADRGWIAALDDARVEGVLLLDGYAARGPWYPLARAGALLRRPPRAWLGVLRRRLRRGGPGADPTPASAAYRDWPTRREARRQLRALLARDVRLLLVYTSGVPDYFRDARQVGWSFGRAARDARVRWQFWPDCDHTFFARFARERLLLALEDWFAQAFAARSPG
jgi:hypothetical protein